MPYNTRRKSLSLPSLGIHVPITHAARTAAHRASASQSRNGSGSNSSSSSSSSNGGHSHSHSNGAASPSLTSASAHRHHTPTAVHDAPTDNAQRPPNKRAKRSHGSDASAATPPPSPKALRHPSVEMDDGNDDDVRALTDGEIDMDTINDDIVEAVILQLLSTGNRPHLIKELAALLMQHLRSVQQSANPCAIISSRLATYMKRSCWSASSPCPLTKELETIHPRRTYYYLTTSPHLPLPDASSPAFIVPRTSIITPPLSSAASASESVEEERRRELSPSPEVDLSSPEFDDVDDDIPMPGTPIGSSSLRFSHLSRASYISRSQRGASPPLEKDEKEFTQTAEGLQKRKLAGHALLQPTTLTAVLSTPPSAATLVFGLDDGRDDSLLFSFGLEQPRHLSVNSTAAAFLATASPAMQPTLSLGQKKEAETDGWAKLDSMLDWDRSPENVALEELDGLLDDF